MTLDEQTSRAIDAIGVETDRDRANAARRKAIGEQLGAALQRLQDDRRARHEKRALGSAEKTVLGSSEKCGLGSTERAPEPLPNLEKPSSGKPLSAHRAALSPDTSSLVISPTPTHAHETISTSDAITQTDTAPALSSRSDILFAIRASRAKYQPHGDPKPASIKARRPSAPKATKHRTHPVYAKLTIPDQAAEHHKALTTLGPVHAMTINLSPEIEALARSHVIAGQGAPNPLAYLHRRIRMSLAAAGLPRAFWIIPEEAPVDDAGHCRLHVHGEITCSKKEASVIREVLRKAGGPWEENRQFQVFLDPEPDLGWVRYACKGLPTATITGTLFSATDDLGAFARRRYGEWRARENLKLRKGGGPPRNMSRLTCNPTGP